MPLKSNNVPRQIDINIWGHRDRDRMVVELTTTYAISAYHQ
jgi:hypothetical protein